MTHKDLIMRYLRIKLVLFILLLAPGVLAATGDVPWYAPALDPLLSAVGLALAGLLSWLAGEAIRWLRAQVSSQRTQEALVLLTEATEAAANEIGQSYVDALKASAADGKLTLDEATEARRKAVTKARDLLGEKGLATLDRALGGSTGAALEAWLTAKVEQAVRVAK